MLHLRYLDQESLAHRVHLEQRAMGWPGLSTEVEEICRQLNIESVHTTNYNKYEYKQMLTRDCHIKNEQILMNLSEGREKCSRIQKEAYGGKEYIEKKYIQRIEISTEPDLARMILRVTSQKTINTEKVIGCVSV